MLVMIGKTLHLSAFIWIVGLGMIIKDYERIIISMNYQI